MRTFKLILFVLFLIIVGVGYYFLFGNYSDGYRGGTMIKFSRKGILMKTYEGELNLGMVLSDNPSTTSASIANIWYFSVPSGKKEVINRLDSALLTGHRVKVHYNEKFFKLPWRGDTKYVVDEVEVLK
jgi:hypothetical protein